MEPSLKIIKKKKKQQQQKPAALVCDNPNQKMQLYLSSILHYSP